MSESKALGELWDQAKEQMLKRMNFSRAASEAVLNAVPVMMTDDVFVLGLPVDQANLSSQLTAPQNKMLLGQILTELTEAHRSIEIISGTTLDDWERNQEYQATRQRVAEETANRSQARAQGERNWRAILQDCSMEWSSTANRGSELTKAQFVLKWVNTAATFEQEHKAEDPGNKSEKNQGIDRIIARLAGMVGIPNVVVALELEKARRACNKD